MPQSPSARTRIPKTKPTRPKDADSGKLRIGDDGNAFRLLALSQCTARVEFLGGEPWIARSQAKRLLARLEQFHTVVFDFSGVSLIAPAFADEIFRVFAHARPGIQLEFIHANATIKPLILRARSATTHHRPG